MRADETTSGSGCPDPRRRRTSHGWKGGGRSYESRPETDPTHGGFRGVRRLNQCSECV
ncbi:hypothetical protein FRUB_09488 [Fimbriiglobus ruber]|uniref:Uncharacterized protein n=1 Tax=Fimbriiglobus ruber TaxID=1908690 RepID=A0A225DGU7_9BACT|nr:hypothetical protein FRUB_09488 [Fimbriiglobus ruber]